MKRTTLIKTVSGIVIVFLLLTIFIVVFLKPWIEKKIFSALSEADPDYTITIEETHILFLPPGIVLEGVGVQSNGKRGLDGKTESIKFKGVNLMKLIFKNDLDVKEVVISNSGIRGRMSFDSGKHIVSSLNIRVDKIVLNMVDLEIQNAANKEAWLVRNGFINLYDFELLKKDTLFFRPSDPFDLKAEQVLRISPDSSYTFKADRITCTANYLRLDTLIVHPNYKDYDFTSRYEFQTDRIEAVFSNISLHDFSAANYLKSNVLVSSLMEIESMDMNVFRDRRKPFRHKKNPMLQDVLYDYPGKIKVDSIRVVNGNVSYTEHAENSKEPGSIHFEKINATIFNVTNDTIYKTKNGYVELKSEALLMGAAKINFHLKAKLFDSTDVFVLKGNLSSMEVRDLNPILERNAFMHAESGTIDTMYFNFTANNYASSGEMMLLYHMLFLKTEGEHAVVPASLFQLIVSSIASKKILDANPTYGEKARAGTIAYERDPEKFVFNYCFKSMLSGIKSSITKNQDVSSRP